MALGIGANTAIFTVDYATLLAPLPFPQPNQLVMVWSSIQGNRNGVAAGDAAASFISSRVAVFLRSGTNGTT